MTKEEKNQLAEENLGLIYAVINKKFNFENVTEEDKKNYFEEGMIGLAIAINNYDTGETIGKAIIKEFYNDKITENSIYRTDFCGRSLFLDDTFIEEVIFEPDKNINFDDLKANDGYDLEYQLYIANHCDVRVHISAIDGRIFIEERDKDNNMIEYSLFELSQKNKQ